MRQVMQTHISLHGSRYGQMAMDYGVRLAGRLGAEAIALYVVSLKSLEATLEARG